MFQYRDFRERFALLALGGLVLVGFGYIGAIRTRPTGPLTIETVGAVPKTSREEAAAPNPEIVVYVTGAVRHPGIHHLKRGDRIDGAVTAAGGPSATADLDHINLAEKLDDGEMIHIPKRGELPVALLSGKERRSARVDLPPAGGKKALADKSDGTPDQPVNLNRATAEELEAVPGIGPATAQRILEFRHRHGDFHSVDELMTVGGIGEKRLAKMRPWLSI